MLEPLRRRRWAGLTIGSADEPHQRQCTRALVRAGRTSAGFHAGRRGARAVRRGAAVSRRRRRCRDRHLLRQIYFAARCGGATNGWRALYGRPSPRLGGTPGRLGIPRRLVGRRGHRAVRHAADVPSHARRRRSGRPRGGSRGQVTDCGPGLAVAAAVLVHRRRTFRSGGHRGLQRMGEVGEYRRGARHP